MQVQGEPTVDSPPSSGRPEQDAGGDGPSQVHSNPPVGRKNLLLPEASLRSRVFVDLPQVDAADLQKQLWLPHPSARRVPEAVVFLVPRSSSAPDNLPGHPELDTSNALGGKRCHVSSMPVQQDVRQSKTDRKTHRQY